MEEKSAYKEKRWLGRLISILMLMAISAGVLCFYPELYRESVIWKYKAQEAGENWKEEQKTETLRNLQFDGYAAAYGFYWDFKQNASGTSMTPAQVFLPEYLWKNTEDITEPDSSGQTESDVENINEYSDFLEEAAEGYRLEISEFNSSFTNWYHNFKSEIGSGESIKYYAVDAEGNVYTNASEDLSSYLEDAQGTQTSLEQYEMVFGYSFDEEGKVTLFRYSSDESEHVKVGEKELSLANVNYLNLGSLYDKVKSPKNMSVVYAINKNSEVYGDYYYEYYWEPYYFQTPGFYLVYFGAFAIVLLVALILPAFKILAIGKRHISKIPFEFNVIAFICTLSMAPAVAELAYYTESGKILEDVDTNLISMNTANGLLYGFNGAVWFCILGIFYAAAVSSRQIFTLGLLKYLKEKWLIVRIIRFFWRKIKGVILVAKKFDLHSQGNKALIIALAINLVAMSVCTVFWYFGTTLSIIYTIVLFLVLGKYWNEIKRKYNLLFDSVHRMAEGSLDVSVTEDLGMFNPLRDELSKVQEGFKLAVEEEVKSQNMKAELVTNVSHDLKTPLTAIITYISLLKEENISEEERMQYIQTLDEKSLRLKKLIEDLFEISKASTGNVTLHRQRVDLAALLQQVIFELGDKIKESDIEFRVNIPQERIEINADSEKTYRIFENLIVNIVKYGMPHTRAYINMEVNSRNQVMVTLKNISATELNFTPEEISERFVRGDKSRNTEGSGLGLAIAKSFTELQEGNFRIQMDGDLFKVIVEFERIAEEKDDLEKEQKQE